MCAARGLTTSCTRKPRRFANGLASRGPAASEPEQWAGAHPAAQGMGCRGGEPVMPMLEALGYRADSVDLPCRVPAATAVDHAQAVVAAIDAIEGPIHPSPRETP